jgi:hypothetical protein
MKWLRKLRGLLGVGLTWGLLWGAIGAAIGLVVGLLDPGAWTLANPVAEWALGLGVYGVVSGVGFGGLLSLGEGKRTLRDLSLRRVALWGVLGSAAVPLLFLGFFDAGTSLWDVVSAMLVTAGLGGTFAPGAIVVARRAELSAPDRMGLLEDVT